MSRLENTRSKRRVMLAALITGTIVLSSLAGAAIGWFSRDAYRDDPSFFSPFIQDSDVAQEKPLQKYAFRELAQTQINPAEIKIIETIQDSAAFTSYLFNYTASGGTI